MHKNFNVGFASHKNDIHIQLSQWQYWWWFWFAAVWALYFFVILRCYMDKTDNFDVSLNTSMRSHGKWGDFLVALIPLSWCGNILVNSNFILRMIEWQNESSLFTVRINAKQWYWAYKYSSDTNFRLNNVYINVGNNNWWRSNNQGTLNFNKNNSLLTFIFDYEFKKLQKKNLYKLQVNKGKLNKLNFFGNLSFYGKNFSKNYKFNLNFFQNYKTLKFFKIQSHKFLLKNNYINSLNISNFISKWKENNFLISKKFVWENCSITEWMKFNKQKKYISWYVNSSKSLSKELIKTIDEYYFIRRKYINKHQNLFNLKKNKYLFDSDKLDDTFNSAENLRVKNSKFPIRLLKGIINKHNIKLITNNQKLSKNILFNYKINKLDITEKISHFEQFWGFRQKKYKKLRSYSFPTDTKYCNITYKYLTNYMGNFDLNKYNLYLSSKNNKYKNELIPVTLARRLLRTKRTLILPAHINLTLITNSYDVVHSWFVPGLGLKLDCVPGRSTHHSLYIDNVGFYYGQCAEICGRYHHHMPIRVCALPFEHFMLWWQTKGLPRMYRLDRFDKNKNILLNKFKY